MELFYLISLMCCLFDTSHSTDMEQVYYLQLLPHLNSQKEGNMHPCTVSIFHIYIKIMYSPTSPVR